MREGIEQALDEYARPILREHCGEVEVTRIQGDTVFVRLLASAPAVPRPITRRTRFWNECCGSTCPAWSMWSWTRLIWTFISMPDSCCGGRVG
jgi:hypothetical protein